MERIIWSNTDIDVKNWSDFLQEEYPEVTDPNEQYELCYEMNANYLDDERVILLLSSYEHSSSKVLGLIISKQ